MTDFNPPHTWLVFDRFGVHASHAQYPPFGYFPHPVDEHTVYICSFPDTPDIRDVDQALAIYLAQEGL